VTIPAPEARRPSSGRGAARERRHGGPTARRPHPGAATTSSRRDDTASHTVPVSAVPKGLVRHGCDRRTSRRALRRALAGSVAAAAVVGVTIVAGVSQAATPNLVDNPGLENGLTGWFAAQPFMIERVRPGHRGSYAVRLANTGGTTRTGALNDLVNTVEATKAGHTYQARAYVRSDVAGRTVAVRVMEYKGTTRRGEAAKDLALPDTGWHRVSLRYTAATDGASLDFNVLGRALPAGGSIVVDSLKLVDEGDGGTAVPAPAATATASPAPSATATAGPTASAAPAPTPTGTATTSASAAPSAPRSPAPGPSTTTPGGDPPPAGWTLAWADEFDDGALDPARWTAQHLSTFGDGNSELACLMNRPENVFERGGTLTIRARKETTPVTCGSSDARFPDGRSYTSGMLRTTASWTYGRFEMRAKLPTSPGDSKGLWPAFWMRPAAGGTGELDILEAIGSSPGGNTAQRIHQTIWYDYAGTHPKETFTALTAFDPSAGFHTYAVEWDPGQIRWYVDGRLTWSRTTSSTAWLEPAFSKPFFIRLNLAVGGSWPGSPDSATSFPADYAIDYVRVYQR